jgi:hypothetical protein
MNRQQVNVDFPETMYQQLCRLAQERNTTPGRLLSDAIRNWIFYPKPAYLSNREGIPANTSISQSSLDGMTPEQTYPGANNPLQMYNAQPPELRPGYCSYVDEQLSPERYIQPAEGRLSDHYPDGILRTPTVPGTRSVQEITEYRKRTN